MALDAKTIEAIKNTSEEELSAVERAIKRDLVDEKDARILEILKRADPEKYRDYLVLAEKAGELPHVKPGDLITSQLINALIDRINAFELGGESVLRLGPLAQGAHTLVALGGPTTAGGGLWVDGERLLDKEKEVANLALLDGSSLEVQLTLVADESKREQAIEQLTKLANKGDVLMMQMGIEEKASSDGVTVETRTTLIHTYIGVIQANSQYQSALFFLNSIQTGHHPFTWGLYNTKLKRFVLGGASEDFRLQESMKLQLNVRG